jgi:hypothetical protein
MEKIEDFINEVLTGDIQKNALEFIACLRVNGMLFERVNKGYWEDKLYWYINYKGKSVCFILINGYEKGHWTIWSDDDRDSNWFRDFPLDEKMKEIAWKNVDICENCGSCGGGTNKTIFGKDFNNVCCTVMRFTNPDVETLECMKKMVEIRKNDILINRVVQ